MNSYRHGGEQESAVWPLAAPNHGQQHAEKAAFYETLFIPFSPTGISRWEWMRQGTILKLCGQSSRANAERKVTATLLGDSSDYFLLGIRYSVLSQMTLELPSLPLPFHAEHGWTNKQTTSRKSFGEKVSKRLQGVLEKNNWLSFGWKKETQIWFFSPSILWSAPTTGVSSREAGGLTASCTCCVDPGSASLLCYGLLVWPWASHSPPLWFASPCCKTRPIIQAGLTGRPSGEDIFLDIVEYLNSFWVKALCRSTMPCPSLEARLPNVHRPSHNDSVILFGRIL